MQIPGFPDDFGNCSYLPGEHPVKCKQCEQEFLPTDIYFTWNDYPICNSCAEGLIDKEEELSGCCGAPRWSVAEESDICSRCKEHADFEADLPEGLERI